MASILRYCRHVPSLTPCVLAWLVLPVGDASADVLVDINQADHLKLRFEKVVVLVADPDSKAVVTLDLGFPGLGLAWRGLEFGVLAPGNTGYRASAVSADGSRIAVADFRLADATFNPLARLPISGEGVLAQSWTAASGTVPAVGGSPEVSFVWNVNQSVGAGFGMFGTLEAIVVPEPGVAALAGLGVAIGLMMGGVRRSRS